MAGILNLKRWVITPDFTLLGRNNEKEGFRYASPSAKGALSQHYGGIRCVSTFIVDGDGRYSCDRDLQKGHVVEIVPTPLCKPPFLGKTQDNLSA